MHQQLMSSVTTIVAKIQAYSEATLSGYRQPLGAYNRHSVSNPEQQPIGASASPKIVQKSHCGKFQNIGTRDSIFIMWVQFSPYGVLFSS